MSLLDEYYETRDEEARLLSQHGQVEYLTTMKYIHECLSRLEEKKILEVGAGTGRYSIALAKEGYSVTAVELVEHNLDILKSKLDGSENLTAIQGNALDLSEIPDRTFDLTMLLGPMYHLYTFEDKRKALSEAVRVTKEGGYILVAYCMNEPTVIQYVFMKNHLDDVFGAKNMLTDDWHCISEPEEIFELVRTEDIDELNACFPLDRVKLVATDGATNYMRDLINGMDMYTFGKWMEYHFATCERQDLIGASHHTLDILRVRAEETCETEKQTTENLKEAGNEKKAANEGRSVRLVRVDGNNVWDILKLKVAEDQEGFVAPNDLSLVEAYLSVTANGHAFPFGIYDGNKAVGFLMIGYDVDDNWRDAPEIARGNYNLWRLMIDRDEQGKGYGRAAVELALDFIRSFPCGKAEYCFLSYEPENEKAKKLYQSFGFAETGDMDGDEIIAVLKL